jgi:VIT1/CCC1 family predicted Fe2+/Mn2+ transporter
MALSEREQRTLEQLEQQFKEDDPQFAEATETIPRPTIPTRRIIAGVLAAVTGLAPLLVALSLPNDTATLLVGVTGFAIMVAGAYLATKSLGAARKDLQTEKTMPAPRNTAPSSTRMSKDIFKHAGWWSMLRWL